jgi:hypothetical protein
MARLFTLHVKRRMMFTCRNNAPFGRKLRTGIEKLLVVNNVED